MSRYAQGRRREWLIQHREKVRPDVYCCIRSARSLSPVDLISFCHDGDHLIQVKMNRPSRRLIKDLEVLADDYLTRYVWVVIVGPGGSEEWWRYFPPRNAHGFYPSWYRYQEGFKDLYETWELIWKPKKPK